MMHEKIKRAGAVGVVALYLFSSSSVLAQVCSSSSSNSMALDSSISVIGDNRIRLGSGGAGTCHVNFHNSPKLNANDGAITMTRPQNVGEFLCRSRDNNGNLVTIDESGSPAQPRPVIVFLESSGALGNRTYENRRFEVPGGDYDEIVIRNDSDVVFTGPVKAKKFTCRSQNGHGVTFFPGQNYFNIFEHVASCNVRVGAGTTIANPVYINILGKTSIASTASVNTTLAGGSSCINYLTGNPLGTLPETNCDQARDLTSMQAQHPEYLQINVLNGNVNMSAATSAAAGLYVANGGIKADNGQFTWVGAMLANGTIETQDNTNTNFYYKATPMEASSVDTSPYSLAPPAVEAISGSGSIIYRTMQRDYQDDGSRATSGHLKAYKLAANSTQEATPIWDAAARQDVATRTARIKTQIAAFTGADTDFELLSSTSASAFSGMVNGQQRISTVEQILDPASVPSRLDGRYSRSLIGAPWRTKPIIVGNSVLFAADDGILYSVKKGEASDSGSLNWGWIPRQLLPHTASYSDLAAKHAWGQISAVTEDVRTVALDGTVSYDRRTYIVGTAMGGQLHFALKVSAEGDRLEGVSWIDDKTPVTTTTTSNGVTTSVTTTAKFSPGSAQITFGVPATNSGGRSAAGAWPGGVPGGPAGGAAPSPAIAPLSDGPLKVAYVYGTVSDGMSLMIRNLDGTGTPSEVAFRAGGTERSSSVPPVVTRVSSNLLFMNDDAIYFGTPEGRVKRSDTTGQLSDEPGDVDLGVTTPIVNLNGAPISSGDGAGMMLTAQTAERLVTLKYIGGTWSQSWWVGIGANNHSVGVTPIPGASSDTWITAAPDIVNGKVVMYITRIVSGCISGYAFGPLDLLTGIGVSANTKFRVTENVAEDFMNWISGDEATGGSITKFGDQPGVLTSSSKGTSQLDPRAGAIKQRLNWRELTNFF